MKKIIIGVIISTLVLIIIFFWASFSEFAEKQSFVSIEDGVEERIVLVNIGEGDRKYISTVLNRINSCNPTVIGIDAFFKELKDPISDSLLKESISQSNIVLGVKHNGIGPHGTHRSFINSARAIGIAELYVNDEQFADSYFLSMGSDATMVKHISVVITGKYDKEATNKFLEKNKTGDPISIRYSRLSDQFKVYDYQALNFNCDELKERIVLLGYLGPTAEDKFKTYSRYHSEDLENGPDMYGVVIIANQILTVLDDG